MVLKSKVFESVVLILILFLSVVLYFAIASESGIRSDGNAWNTTSYSPVSYIQVGNDGTLFICSGDNSNNISAISADGNLRWRLRLPDSWVALNRFIIEGTSISFESGGLHDKRDQIFTTDNGGLYLYAGEITSADPTLTAESGFELYSSGDLRKMVVAISPEGIVLWKTPLSYAFRDITMAGIYVKNGTIYVYDEHKVTVLDNNGKIIFSVDNVTRELTVDDENNLYVVRCVGENHNPGSVVESYGQDGSLKWKKDLGEAIFVYPPGDPVEFNTVLLYHNHTIHVPTVNNVYTLDDQGNILRVKNFEGLNYAPFKPMPIDSQGNLYLELNGFPPFIDVLSTDGKERLLDKPEYHVSFKDYENEVVYRVEYSRDNTTQAPMNDTDLIHAKLIAYDLLHDRYLWNYTFVPDVSVIDSPEVEQDLEKSFIFTWSYHTDSEYDQVLSGNRITYGHKQDSGADQWSMDVPDNNLYCNWGTRLVPGKDVIYVNYYTYNRKTLYNTVKYYFSNKIYAFDKNGTLRWTKPIQSPVTSMAVNNSTLYYGTQDGRLFAENTGLIAGGFAIIAILYLIIRFFLVGTVARAKDRLNKNENRNCIVQYVTEHPGSTLGDISRGLKMNIGTVRYHILILDMNHRISALQADDKHIRYFQASGQYSMEDRLVMSLARRDGMKKVLGALLDKPGLSNMDLSRELNLKESAVSRYMKVLTARGVVDRRPVSGGYLSYSISASHIESVCRVIRQEKF